MSLPTLQQFLDHANTLSYQGRREYAMNVAEENKSNPDLKVLIKDLRAHPDPVAPEVTLDEGFVKVLMPQQTSISKFYHMDQMALVMAQVIEDKDIFSELLDSPSIFFERQAVTQWAKLSEAGEIYEKILVSTPSIRRKLISKLIGKQDTAILDTLIGYLHDSFGSDEASKYLHGCSSSVVAEYLERDDYKNNSHLRWNPILRFHGKVILEKLENDLSNFSDDYAEINRIWSQFSAKHSQGKRIRNFLHKGKHGQQLVGIWTKYPSTLHDNQTNNRISVLPSIIASNGVHLFRIAGEQIVKHLISENVTKGSYARCYKPENIYGYFKKSRYETFKRFLDKFLETHSSSVVDIYGNLGVSLLQKVIPAGIDYSNLEDLHTFLYQKLKPLYLTSRHLRRTERGQKSSLDDYNHRQEFITNQMSYLFIPVQLMKNRYYERKNYCKRNQQDFDGSSYLSLQKKFFTEILEIARAFTEIDSNSVVHLLTHAKLTLFSNSPDLLFFAYESLKPDLEIYKSLTKEFIEHNAGFSGYDEVLSSLQGAVHVIAGMRKKKEFEADFDRLSQLIEEICSYVFSIAESDLVKYYLPITNLATFATPEKRLQILDMFSTTMLVELIENSQNAYGGNNAIENLFNLFSTEALTEKLAPLLDHFDDSESIKNFLMRYQNVNDHAIRKALQKKCDSKSVSIRNEALGILFSSTLLSSSETRLLQLSRTLRYLRKKIKNESNENRVEFLEVLISSAKELESSNYHEGQSRFYLGNTLFMEDTTEEQIELYTNIFQDGIESQDYEYDFLQHFQDLSMCALNTGTKTNNKLVFDFGVDIQFKIGRLTTGARDLMKSFQLNLPSLIEFGSQNQFFSNVINAYETTIGEKNKDWKFDEKYPRIYSLFVIAKYDWEESPLLELLEEMIQNVESSKKDPEGLFIIEENHVIVEILEHLIRLYKINWEKVEIIQRIMMTLIHSRLAPKYIYQYLKRSESVLKTKKEKHEFRNQYVEKLLSISKSAIYIKFVKNFLVNHRQDLLDQYINQSESFRGVFNTGKEKMRLSSNAQKYIIENQENLEEQMRQEVACSSFEDHEDFFTLNLTYGLHKLLPRQADELAKQNLVQLSNPDRSMDDRIKATIRYTLLPNTTYCDLVEYIDTHKDDLPVQIYETLLKGFSSNDEPAAPLNYLLTPDFLGSDFAKIAAYRISASVSYMKPSMITEILKLLLTGKTREGLKVTAYKEIIRVLSSVLSQEHLDIILHEWERKNLHRDVRVTIIKCATKFLFLENETVNNTAWKILHSAVADYQDNPEIQVALLGASAENITPAEKDKTVLFNPKWLEYFDELSSCKIPVKHSAKYASDIVLPLTESNHDDVKTLAILCLADYSKFFAKEAAEKITTALTDLENEHLRNEKHRNVNIRRLSVLAETLMRVTLYQRISTEYVQQFLTTILRFIITSKDRNLRTIFMQVFDAYLNEIPVDLATRCDVDGKTRFTLSEIKTFTDFSAAEGLYLDHSLRNRFKNITLKKHSTDSACKLLHELMLLDFDPFVARCASSLDHTYNSFEFVCRLMSRTLKEGYTPTDSYNLMTIEYTLQILGSLSYTLFASNCAMVFLEFLDFTFDTLNRLSNARLVTQVSTVIPSFIESYVSYNIYNYNHSSMRSTKKGVNFINNIFEVLLKYKETSSKKTISRLLSSTNPIVLHTSYLLETIYWVITESVNGTMSSTCIIDLIKNSYLQSTKMYSDPIHAYFEIDLIESLVTGRLNSGRSISPDVTDISNFDCIDYTVAEKNVVFQIIVGVVDKLDHLFIKKPIGFLSLLQFMMTYLNVDRGEKSFSLNNMIRAAVTKQLKDESSDVVEEAVLSFIMLLRSTEQYPEAAKLLAVDLISVFGFAFGIREDETKTKVVWKEEWLTVLDELCVDSHFLVRRKALEVNPLILVSSITYAVQQIWEAFSYDESLDIFGW